MSSRRWAANCAAAGNEPSAASRLASAAAGLRGMGSGTGRSRRHGSRFAWCSEPKWTTTVSAGSAAASRLRASVVLRVNTTVSSLRAPTNACTVTRASSYAAVATCDL